MVYCQLCKKNIATVHYTEIDAEYNVQHESHLCESCAQKKDLTTGADKVSPFQLLENLIKPATLPEQLKSLLSAECDECGMTYAEFRSGGRLGCPKDYEVFRDGIMAVLEQVQGVHRHHVGKVPRRAGKLIGLKSQLGRLNRQLAEAVTLENYETAAELRDQIAALERAIADPDNASEPGAGASEPTAGAAGEGERAEADDGEAEHDDGV